MSADRPLLAFEDLPSESPEELRARATRDARARRYRIAFIVAGTVLAHSALFLALGAIPTAGAKSPPPAREVEVMRFEAVRTPGGAAVEWQGEGGRRVARIRPDPAMYGR